MGAWGYCRCGEGYKPATFKEVFIGFATCENCGNQRQVDDLERELAVNALMDRIESLEADVKRLKDKQEEL